MSTPAQDSIQNVHALPTLAPSAQAEAAGRDLHERLLLEAREHIHEAATAPDDTAPARRNFLRLVIDGGSRAALAVASCAALIAVVDPSVQNGVWSILAAHIGWTTSA